MIAAKEEIAKAEVEAWHRTHYRLDWLLYRTLGYAILSSTLAIYIFWAEIGRGGHETMGLTLSVVWVLLLGMAMLWYDFHTRVSYENWPEVRQRLSRHLLVSVSSFAAAIIFANAIHGVSIVLDRMSTPASDLSMAGSNAKGGFVRPVHGRKPLGLKPLPSGVHGVLGSPSRKSPPKATPSDPKNAKVATSPAATRSGPAAKTVVTKAAAPAKSAPPAKKVSKPAPKPAPKKVSNGLPSHPYSGQRTVWQGRRYHYYNGRWHMLRRQR